MTSRAYVLTALLILSIGCMLATDLHFRRAPSWPFAVVGLSMALLALNRAIESRSVAATDKADENAAPSAAPRLG